MPIPKCLEAKVPTLRQLWPIFIQVLPYRLLQYPEFTTACVLPLEPSGVGANIMKVRKHQAATERTKQSVQTCSFIDSGQCGIATGLMAGLADPALARALTGLHEHPGKAWTLQAMAQQAGMSRSAFAARLKEVVGTTPVDYLIDWRLALAKARLRRGDAVKLIADNLGYANASALSRVFAQRVGMSPRAWLATPP